MMAVVMVLSGSLLTAGTSGDITFPAILGMLGLVGLQGRFTWDIRPERRFITALLLLLLAVLFAFHCRYAYVRGDQAAIFAWQTITRYFLASMTLILFLRRPDRLPPSLGLFHMATALAAGQVLLLDDRYIAFRMTELLGVTLVVFYAAVPGDYRLPLGDFGWQARVAPGARPPSSVPRPPRLSGASHFVLLVLAMNIGWVVGSLMYRHVETLNFLPAWFWRGGITLGGGFESVAQVGFSTSGRLSGLLEIKQDQNPAPVLNIISESSPGYLRARAFDRFAQSEWQEILAREDVFAERSTSFTRFFVARLFRVSRREASRFMTIRHETALADAMFTPLGVATVEAPFDSLTRDEYEIIRPPSTRGSMAYRVGYASWPPTNPPGAQQMRRMLKPPSQLDPRIQQLADQITAGCHTTAEKIEAVVKHFRTRYTYSLSVETPRNEDKLTYFLLHGTQGYCEYFASGAAILLRCADVPTRYVTGFLVTERGERPDLWFARNMDAHAWVEAWDRERGQWAIVEATVQDVVAADAADEASVKGPGRGRIFLAQLLGTLYDYGLFGVFGWLFTFYGPRTGLSLCLSFLGAACGVALLRRHRRARRTARSASARAAELAILHRMLAAMDRKVKGLGFRRGLQETLQTFADRLRQDAGIRNLKSQIRDSCGARPASAGLQSIADWYLAYADLRYARAPDPGRPDAQRRSRIEQLHQSARRL
jgi:transglutaminase-like putative cysteine protease